MRFGNPQAFAYLWLIPVIWFAALAFERQARKKLAEAFGKKVGPFLTSSVSNKRRQLKLAMKLLALTFFILALARPQMGKSMQEVKLEGVELMIAFDVSTSMLAEDVKPSRIEYAKAEVSKLLDLLGGDKVGLVAFAGSSVLLSPMTTDKSALKMYLESLSPYTVETQGTDIHKALGECKNAFERGGVEGDETHKVTRVILVASDGEDNEPGALEEAKKLSGEGIKIFTLAFGTEHGGTIPLRDERGFLRNYKRDKKGQDVVSVVKGDFLKELAQIGGGSFYHSTYGGGEALKVKNDMDRLQKEQFSSSLATSYDEKYQIPLAIGLLFALGDLLISERKKAGKIWKGRFEVNQ